MLILAADIGGPHARLLLSQSRRGAWHTLRQQTLHPDGVGVLLERIPLPVVLDEQPGLRGAALVAARQAQEAE